MEVALHKNNSDCKTNSDGGAEDAELGNFVIIVGSILMFKQKLSPKKNHCYACRS